MPIMRDTHSYQHGWLTVVLLLAPLYAVAQQPGEPATVDEQTAEAYNKFTQLVQKQMDRACDQFIKRYQVPEERQAAVRELAKRNTDEFLRQNGQGAHEVYQRVQAVGEAMKEARGDWRQLPVEIRQDLAGRVLPMMDSVRQSFNNFGENVADQLDEEQKARLADDRRKMELGFTLAKVRVRVLGGLASPEEAAQAAQPAGAARPGEEAPSGAGQGADRPAGPLRLRAASAAETWEKYVRRFIERYKLDEIQKLQAMDLLAKYKTKAEALDKEPQSQPAVAADAPASQPSVQSMDDFRRRLEVVKLRNKPVNDLFEQLKAELEKIPSPVQRRLAEEATDGQRPADSPAPPAQRPLGESK